MPVSVIVCVCVLCVSVLNAISQLRLDCVLVRLHLCLIRFLATSFARNP